MIKASAGGGGGMRIAYKRNNLKELIKAAKSEAKIHLEMTGFS